MAYTKQNFEDGQVLKAEHLNHIEDGLSNIPIETAENFILPTTDLTFEMNEDLGAPIALVNLNCELFDGHTYTVNFAGTEYQCQCIGLEGTVFMGNSIVVDGDDTGEPFTVVSDSMATTTLVIAVYGHDSATVSISGAPAVRISDNHELGVPVLDLFVAGAPMIVDTNYVSFELDNFDVIANAYRNGGIVKVRFLGQFASRYNALIPSMSPHYVDALDPFVYTAFTTVSRTANNTGEHFFLTGFPEAGLMLYVDCDLNTNSVSAVIRRLSFETVT